MMPPEISPFVLSQAAPLATSLVQTRFDASASALWVTMHSRLAGIEHFSRKLLQALQENIEANSPGGAKCTERGAAPAMYYAILRSDQGCHFSLGSDLDLLLAIITKQNATALHEYAMQIIDTVYLWRTAWNRELTTISLVQGRAFGPGFEMALASDYIIADENAEFGFPETVYGLLPYGGLSLLGHRVGLAQADRMLRSGKLYRAAELMDMGVVDRICPSGRGTPAAREFIEEHAQRRAARVAIQRARSRMQPLERAELLAAGKEWARVAAGLSAQDLHALRALLRMQRGDRNH
jgi:DSF synthase